MPDAYVSAAAVLALGANDTALRERIKAERERCAMACDVLMASLGKFDIAYAGVADSCATVIRALED